jgi:predicted P-loop ATPase
MSDDAFKNKLDEMRANLSSTDKLPKVEPTGRRSSAARKSPPAGAPALAGAGPAWPDANKYGLPLRTYRNARAAILHMVVACRYDVFHDQKLVGGHVLGEWAGALSDAVSAILRQMIVDRYDFDPGKDAVNDAAVALCIENTFDPILEFLDGLKWDGRDRLSNWFTTYLGAISNRLHSEVGKLMLVAAVRRVRQPGCKFDHVVVFEGPEGTRKSTAVQVLAGSENFSDQTILTASDKEQQELVRGCWIYELSDLAGMRRAEVEKIKAFVSRTHDRTRPAYGRHRVDAPRRNIFAGTTNESAGYLKSQTGNRRWSPVRVAVVGKIDIEALRRDREQLWAQAAAVEVSGIPLTLPEEVWAEARAAQEERREHDPWEEELINVSGAIYPGGHGDEERVRTSELLKEKLGITAKEANSAHSIRLARVMTAIGWTGPKMLRFGVKADRGYFRPAKAGEE